MAERVLPEPVHFFVGVLAADTACVDAARGLLQSEWGPVVCEREPRPWAYTKYYEKEAGTGILRAFFAFDPLMDPVELAARKVRTNDMEVQLAAESGLDLPRPVNLDPGYLAPDKLVLASCKNFAHRIYLDQGVYAEITLLYRHRRFESLEWTFPDYGSGEYDSFFLALRNRLRSVLDQV